MTRSDYLIELRRFLDGIPEEDKAEILYDYEEHFRVGLEKGKSEEEIAASLGDARMIARQFKADYTIQQAEAHTSAGNTFRAVLAAVGMGFFNLIFCLGPFLGIAGLLLGLFMTAVAIVISGIALFLAYILGPVFPSLINMDVNGVFAVASSIGITCMGLLLFIGVCYLVRYFFIGTVKYLRWNIEIIKSK